MRMVLLIAAAAALWVTAPVAKAAESINGVWRLESQEVDGEKASAEPMTLKVTQTGDKFLFAFSVPVNKIYFVSMSYTVRMDGSEGDVLNSHGEKVGTVQMSAAGPSKYRLILRSSNRRPSNILISVSADGKALTSESDAIQAGRPVHSKQVFARY